MQHEASTQEVRIPAREFALELTFEEIAEVFGGETSGTATHDCSGGVCTPDKLVDNYN